MTRTAYAFAGKASVNEQLRALTDACDPFTRAGLDGIGIQADWQILDIGAGSGTVATWLADRIGADGMVTATDIDPSRIPAHPRITAVPHNVAADPLPDGYYDLIHSRLVLIHLPDREQILNKLLAALKPGGSLMLHEFDCTARRTVVGGDADDAALFDRVITGINRVLRTAGAQLDWGIAAHTAMTQAGFVDVATDASMHSCRGGDAWANLAAVNTMQLHEQLLDTGLTVADLERFRALMAAPDFVAMSYLMTRTLGRRPQ
ncbi:class I SAM-dependent methyltransferase [Catellatospora sp. NPDC049111]|uniref:class I SAM-dependent methyltransferase n=1 Tax=Catellatospora sp. NPDC049111 TaxID=3155271 RepID=UPI0033D8ABAD